MFSLPNGSFVIEKAAELQPPRPPGAEIAVSTRKQMQIKLLSIAGAYFSESGLFNGLRPIQIKKSRSFPRQEPRIRSGEWERYTTDSDFRKGIVRAVSLAHDMSGLGSARSVR
jgi:hypothetical protein